jgi:hypothetical protein
MHPDIELAASRRVHAERMHRASQERIALELVRARRLQNWADRSARFSAWLGGLARSRRARVG